MLVLEPIERQVPEAHRRRSDVSATVGEGVWAGLGLVQGASYWVWKAPLLPEPGRRRAE